MKINLVLALILLLGSTSFAGKPVPVPIAPNCSYQIYINGGPLLLGANITAASVEDCRIKAVASASYYAYQTPDVQINPHAWFNGSPIGRTLPFTDPSYLGSLTFH